MEVTESRWQHFTAAFAGRLDGGQIADLLWMVQLLASTVKTTEPESDDAPPDTRDRVPEGSSDPVGDKVSGGATSDSQSSSAEPTRQPEALVEPVVGADEASTETTPRVGVAEAGLLRRPRQIGRALAPLSRRVAVGPARWLDVPATVDTIARARVEDIPWRPVLRPRLEPWLTLQLIFDGNSSMVVWQQLRRELPRCLGREVRWRDLRCWNLTRGADGVLALHDARGQRCSAQRLQQADDSSVLIVVSDAIASAWSDGSAAWLLQGWAEQQPLLLLQVLPSRLWPRTGLKKHEVGWVKAERSLQPNGQLQWQPFKTHSLARRARGPATFTLPLVTLEADELAAMARLLLGQMGNGLRGYRLGRPSHAPAPKPPVISAEPPPPLSPQQIEQQFVLFLFNASPQARRLMGLISFAPVITLPVVRLIQRQAGDSGPTHLAEVLFSGLFRNRSPSPIPVDRQLLFFVDEGLRERVREGLLVGEARRVYETVSRYVSDRLNLSLEAFEAQLKAPSPSQESQPGLLLAFALLAPSCLRGLGSRYEQLADEIEQGWSHRSQGSVDPDPDPDPPRFADVDLVTIAVETARLDTIELQELPVKTAQLTKDNAVINDFCQCWSFTESLGSDDQAQLCLTMLEIPAGSFLMGSPDHEPQRSADESPQHLVQLQGFFMGQTPITQAQWRAVMDSNPSQFKDQPDSDQRPVERVSWRDAMAFCQRLRELTGRQYTLPSEAQWEYACRAGTTTPFHFGQTIRPDLANYDASFAYANGPKGEYRKQTTPVGLFPANAWGLQDMHGNVSEWCLDQWHASYDGAPADGTAWVDSEDEKSGARRLLRGGSLSSLPGACRSAYRFHNVPDFAYFSIGFRVVCLPQDPSLNT